MATVMKNPTFSYLFKKYRLKSEFETLSDFGNALAEEGIVYDNSIFSHWQIGSRIPKDRRVLLAVVRLFVKKGGITSISQANDIFSEAGLGYLTESEIKQIVETPIQLSPYNLTYELDYDTLLNDVRNSTDLFFRLEELVILAYKKIYHGYPYLVYSNLKKLTKFIYGLGIDQSRETELISKINWIRARCLSDITKPQDFHGAYLKTLSFLEFAHQKKVRETGSVYWIISAIKRLEIISRDSLSFNKRELDECFELAQIAIQRTSETSYVERVVEHLELAKLALLSKNEYYFNRQIEMAFLSAAQLTSDLKYLEIHIWDIQARGMLIFRKNPLAALEIIQKAKNNTNLKLRSINLYLETTELQTLNEFDDPSLLLYKRRLKEKLSHELRLLKNPYQELRLKQQKLIGV